MSHIDRDNLTVEKPPQDQDSLSLLGDDEITIVLTQAFGPKGDNLVGVSDVTFDGWPALSVRVRCGSADGLVHLSPFHGDRRKVTDLDIAEGAICELLCPVSGTPLERSAASDESDADYFCIYLTPKLSAGEVVLLSNVWGHYSSRIVDNFELISRWAGESDAEG